MAPGLDSLHAPVMWRPEICPTVIPVMGRIERLRPPRMSCERIVVTTPGGGHVLFRDGYRRLQLIVSEAGATANGLATELVVPRDALNRRLAALRRFNELWHGGGLRPGSARPDPSARRMRQVLRILDGDRDGATQREIAIHVVGMARVARDWNDPRGHLRDHVRRCLRRGRQLVQGGYRALLR